MIEGFYGRPWTWDERRAVIRAAAGIGMDAYVHAPKDDPRHRLRWREAYDGGDLASFRRLVAFGEDAGVRVGVGVSPLGMDHRGQLDRVALTSKLNAIGDVGVDWLFVCFDDMEVVPGLASAQAEATLAVLDRVQRVHPDVDVVFVPTVYSGVEPHSYLVELATTLPPDIPVVWTGPDIVSREIGRDELRGWRAVVPHPVVLWDNFFADDFEGARTRVRAYAGRDPSVLDAVDDVLINPTCGPWTAIACLASVAARIADPEASDAAVLEAALAGLLHQRGARPRAGRARDRQPGADSAP